MSDPHSPDQAPDPTQHQNAAPDPAADLAPVQDPTQGETEAGSRAGIDPGSPASSAEGHIDTSAFVDATRAEVGRLAEEAAAATESGRVSAVDLPDFGDGTRSGVSNGINMLGDVDLDVRIELGRTRMLVDDVLRLSPESVVELDKAAGDPVDIYVNGRLVARGEVLVLNENFCVRVSEIIGRVPEAEAG